MRRTRCHNSNWLWWEVPQNPVHLEGGRSGDGRPGRTQETPSVANAQRPAALSVFLQGPAPALRGGPETPQVQPLSQAALGPGLPSSLPRTSGGTCLSSRVCACAEVRPLLCLVRATPLHVCAYVCVCGCALTCLSFLHVQVGGVAVTPALRAGASVP